MRADVPVARYVFALLLRSRLAALLAGFGLAAIGASWVLTELTPGTERRTFFDLAYLGLEALAVLGPLLGSTVLMVQEFDQRILWLVLVRPPSRAAYARGRFWGLAGGAGAIVGGCSIALAALLWALGALPEPSFVPVVVAALLEAAVLAAVAGLVTFVTTSYLTALLVELGIIVLGYLAPLLPTLAGKTAVVVAKAALWVLYWILPHLSEFAVREFRSPAEAWYLWFLGGYAAAYAAGCVLLASAALARRDV